MYFFGLIIKLERYIRSNNIYNRSDAVSFSCLQHHFFAHFGFMKSLYEFKQIKSIIYLILTYKNKIKLHLCIFTTTRPLYIVKKWSRR